MPSLSPLEILIVGVIALIVFGPQKLPEIARTIGRAAHELRRMASEVRSEFEMGLDDDVEDEPEDEPDRPQPRAEEEPATEPPVTEPPVTSEPSEGPRGDQGA